ncbi:MAG TPA: sulfotransferase family 2 domain-containing protein [Pirellulales bacterium]|nr:sulfotransferase family 2 domain-containing protein [Pirellulales bacterium]
MSCYLNKIKKYRNFENEHFADGIMKKFHRFNIFYAGMPFDEFLHAVASIPDELADGHFASQYTRLVMDGEIIVHHLARFEDYQNEVQKILDTVGMDCSIELPHLNGTGPRKPYQEFFTEETRELVQRRYAEDIKLFGYQFDPAFD